MDVSNTRRVVILGKTGAGKSSLANTILGEKLFNTSYTINSETKRCQAETRSPNGKSFTLIDTPGFFDTDRPEEELKCEIVRCITECAPGPHAFLIVLKVEKFTEQEQAVIKKIHQNFSEEVFKYASVVFTHGDQLEEGKKIEDFVRQNKSMSDLLKKCGGRCHVIDNKYWKNNQEDEYRSNKYQVEKILNTIDEITKANKGRCYTNDMLQKVQEIIEQKKAHIRKSSGNMSEEEITRQAKDETFKEICIKVAGVGTGALLGALFGAVAMVVAVVYALKVLVPATKAAVLAAAGAAGAGGTAAGATAAGAVAVGGTAAAEAAAAAGVAGIAAGGGAAAVGGTAAGAVAVGGTVAAEAAAAAAAGVAGIAAGGGAAAVGGTAAGAVAVGGTVAAEAAAAAAGGAAAAGTTAGGAAVAGGLGATGIAFISAGVSAAVGAAAGAAVGGYKGYNAAEEADTPWEAAKMAAAAVIEGAQSIKSSIDEVGDRLKTLNVSSKPTYSKLKES